MDGVPLSDMWKLLELVLQKGGQAGAIVVLWLAWCAIKEARKAVATLDEIATSIQALRSEQADQFETMGKKLDPMAQGVAVLQDRRTRG